MAHDSPVDEAAARASADEVLVKVESVRKKFCRGLKRSLMYGLSDILSEVAGSSRRDEQLRKDEFWAVNDVSFELRKGECLGLIGHNGAGKTTLLKMLNGIIKPDHGTITMRGRVGALIALGAGFNPILTGRENIYVNGAVLGMSKKELDAKLDSIIDFAEIREFIDSPVQGYSSGMTVRLGFAIAAHCQPDILLLDEVLAVGDMGFQAKCFNTIAKFRESGTVFILVTHSMHYISRYCDKVLYLKHGAVEYFGDVERGVERFQNDMAVGSLNAQGEQPEWGRVCGTGKIAICAARFLNSKGEPTQKIASCDPVDLVVDYECRHAAPLPAVLDVLVRDFDGTFYQGSSNDFGVNLDAVTGKGSIVLHFKRLNSNSPVLSFFFTLMNPDTQEFYDWKRNLKLSIGVNPVVNGRVVLDVDWERVDR